MQYRTILQASSDEYTVKRSRFIGYAAPVTTQSEATEFINSIKTKHWDARHNVYAYILRDGQIRRYSDDGEPQGTAGVPVLDVMVKEGITDCAVVVTRYFGGVLLGTGGLVRAYSHSAKIALEAGKIITMKLANMLKLQCDYTFYGRAEPLVLEFKGNITNVNYGENVIIEFEVPKENYEMFENKLVDASNGRCHSQILGEKYSEFT